MGNWTCELDGASIVLIGDFNPSIFQPSWLSEHDLLSEEEAQTAVIQLIRPEVSDFTVDWLKIQVLQNRFAVHTSDPTRFLPLRDIVSGIFTLLEHTPISKMGLNRLMHIRLLDLDDYQEVGDFLAPKSGWESILNTPLLRSMTMEGHRQGSEANFLRIKIEPSSKVPEAIFFEMNEEYDVTKDKSSSRILSLLDDNWEEVLRFSKKSR